MWLSIPEPTRFRAPGAASFDADVPGRYVLWHEYRTVFENRTHDRDPALPAGVTFRLSGPQGAPLELRHSTASTWKSAGTERMSIGQFDVPRPGRITVLVEGEMAPAVIAVGRDFAWPMIGAVIGALLIAMLGLGGGIALALYTFARGVRANGGANAGPRAPTAAATDPFATRTPPADPEKPLRELTAVVYALQAASFLVGVTLIAGVVINYLKRDEVAGTWLESHFRWQIRTFWWMLVWGAVGLVTALILVGFLVLIAAAIWFIYRIAKGWIALSERRAVDSQH